MSSKKESFVVSARKYRPTQWSDVIGQTAITETLDKSIQQDHLAHAYLFCGPRGVGKTTCARIFAKEINRSEDHAEEEDFAFNVFELDAASNNSVEDIRSLTDQVRIPPQVGKYKVYIIDEVHMLSKAAFNAFLKTLEEPPKHAIFILATTEKHKIIPTILSRCQIYDFNRIGVEEIVDQLKAIAQQEDVKYEEDALHVIAQKADGAMRDGLSIFDQLSSFTNQNLTYEAVLKNLHVLDYEYYFNITKLLHAGVYADILVILDEILSLGFDGAHFISGLANHIRDLLVCKHPQTSALLEVGASVQKKYVEQAQSIETEWLLHVLPILTDAEFKYRNAPNQRLLIEVTLLNVCGQLPEKKKASPGLERKDPPSKKPPQESKLDVEEQKKTSIDEPDIPLGQDQSEEGTSTQEPEPELEAEQKPQDRSEETPQPPVAEEEPSPSSKQTEAKPRRPKRRTTSISVDDDMDSDDQPKAEEETQKENDEEAPSDKHDLSQALKMLSEESLKDGKNALYSILAKQDFEQQVLENEHVVVHLNHGVDQEEFNQHSADLLKRLRTLTGNPAVKLSTKVTETKTKTKLFTAQEKFQHLAEQNPKLEKLKKDLDLDFI